MKKFILLTALICGFLVSNSQSYTYIAQRYRWLAGLFEALGMPAGDSAQFKTGQRQQAGAVYYDSTGGDAGFYMWDGVAWVLQGSPTAIGLPNAILNDPSVTYSGTGLKFYVSPVIYRINGLIYATDYDSVTLDAADPDDPRKDVLYVDITGLKKLTGVPAGPAAEPMLSFDELKLTVIDIQQGATTPGLTTNALWDENTEGTVVTNIGTTTDPDNTVFPFHLLKSVSVTSINSGDAIIFTLSSTIDLAAYSSFSFFLKLKAVLPAGIISINFYNGSNAVTPGVSVSYNKNSTNYQGISVSTTRFTSGASNTFIDKIRITFSGVSANQAGFYLDYLTLVSGFLQPGGGSGTPLAMAPVDSNPNNPNGGTISNGLLNLNRVTNSYSGLMTPELKAKLDSLKYNYFIQNGNGLGFVVPLNDTTVLIYGFEAGTGVTIDTVDRKVVISSTGGTTIYSGDGTVSGNRTVNGGGFNLHFSNNRQFNISSASVTGDTVTTLEFNPAIGQGNIATSDLTNTTSLIFRPESLQLNSPLISLSTDNFYFNGSLPSAVSTDSVLTWDATSKQVRVVARSDVGGGGGASIWNGVVIGTTFSATTSTVNNGAVQWTFTGSSPTTFTLPARTSSVNQFYTFKNIGSATLTIAAAGTDDIFTTSSVTSVALLPGESIMITGAANGTSDLWTALFHSSGTANSTGSLRIDRTYGGIQSYFIRTSDTTLVVKDIVGVGTDIEVTTLTDSTNQIAAGANIVKVNSENLGPKRWVARVGSTTSSATPTINTDNVDIYKLTAQTADITSFTTNLSGTPVDGDILEIQVTGTAARAITWGASFVASTVPLPTTTVTTATLTTVFQYFTTSSYGNNKWVIVNSF